MPTRARRHRRTARAARVFAVKPDTVATAAVEIAGLCAALLAAGALVAEPADAKGRRTAATRPSIDLRLETPREAGKLEAVLPDPAVTRPPRKPLTDLVVTASSLGAVPATRRLSGADGDDGPVEGGGESASGGIEAALAAANVTPPPARLFGVRLRAVVAGRIQHYATGVCAGWSDDRSQCRLACDGGRFELIRRLTVEGPTFRMSVSASGDELSAGLLVSQCDGESEIRLVPKPGHAHDEVVLVAE